MSQISVELPADLRDFVGELLAAGRYESESQVLTEGLRLLRSREQLRQDLDVAAAQLDRGEGLDEEEVFEAVEKAIREAEQRRRE